MAAAHDEDVAGWGAAIARWFSKQEPSERVSLAQLQQQLGMPMIEIWMGLLLSQKQQYDWEQQGEFYDTDGLHLKHRSLTAQV